MSVSVPQKDTTTGKDTGAAGLLAKSALVLGTLVVCLVILEIGLRATERFQGDGLIGYHAPRGVSYGLKANVTKRISWPSFSFNVYTDDQGFRSKSPGPRVLGGRPYCAVLGSSEVFANGLDYEQSIVGVFAEKMERDGIDVINMAAPGHHLLEQTALFKGYAASAKPMPKVVLICLNPLFIGGYDDIHDDAIVKMGYLVDRKAWRMALAKVILGNLSASYCFFRDAIRNAQFKYFSRKDFDLSFYIEKYSKHHPVRTPKRTKDFLNHLKDLEGYVRSLRATPVCVYFPAVGGFLLNDLKAKGQINGELFETSFFPDLIQKHCQSEGIQFINVEPPLQILYDQGAKLNFDLDAHFNGPTSRVIGEYLYVSLRPGNGTNSE